MRKRTALDAIDAALMTAVQQVVNSECCSSCSTAMVEPRKTYAYYHEQDVERAFKRGVFVEPMYIGFGSDDDLDDALVIGRKVNRALIEAGFETEWNDDAGRRIKVCPK